MPDEPRWTLSEIKVYWWECAAKCLISSGTFRGAFLEHLANQNQDAL